MPTSDSYQVAVEPLGKPFSVFSIIILGRWDLTELRFAFKSLCTQG